MISLSELLGANPDARLHGPLFADRFSGFSFDSRIVQPGELFLAVRTAKADGHDHIDAACRGGAAGVVCQESRDLASFGATCIVVPDTHAAVELYAAHRVRALGIPVVGITGSVGKTTVKEMLSHVLAARFKIFRNPVNYSGWYGLPIALGGLEEEHEIAVLEMAIDHFGEMKRLTALAPPTVGVVTVVTPAHLRALGDLDGVAREKGALVEALPANGLAVLNADDPRVAAMATRTMAPVVSYGIVDAPGDTDAGGGHAVGILGDSGSSRDSPQAENSSGPAGRRQLEATNVHVTARGTSFTLLAGDSRFAVSLPWLGRQFVGAALASAAVARHFGLAWPEIVGRLATLPEVPGRMNPIPGMDGSLILDDSYNASPAAVLAGLEVLSQLADEQSGEGRVTRVVVLGDMAELGAAAEESHRSVGRRAAEVADVLVTRGNEAAWIAEAAREASRSAPNAAGRDQYISSESEREDVARLGRPLLKPEDIAVTFTAEDAIAAVRPHLGPRTIVYVKGSAVTRMEQVVAGLMAEPERAPERLVRHDAAWRQIVVLQPERPTWLEIDLGALAANTRRLKVIAGRAELMAVLKAEAYGHGAVQVAHTVLRHGASWCAVACLSEGEALRRGGVGSSILVLGYTPAWQAADAVASDLALTVFDLETAKAFGKAALDQERIARLHVKVDSGMHRLGLAPAEAPALLEALRREPGVVVEGLFTHLAAADDLSVEGRRATSAQLRIWERLVGEVEAAGLRPQLLHVAASAGLLAWPASSYDIVRTGIALFGLAPSPDIVLDGLQPVLTWKTQVAQVHELAEGEGVGYGLTWRAPHASRVATIPVGYADGFPRAPLSWRHVLVRGQAAPLVGRVSMDQTGVDVTGIDGARQGDEVVLIGRQGGSEIAAETAAAWLSTSVYEIVATILARVPRVS